MEPKSRKNRYIYEFEIWQDGSNTGKTVTIKASDEELRDKIRKLRKTYSPDEFYELKNVVVMR